MIRMQTGLTATKNKKKHKVKIDSDQLNIVLNEIDPEFLEESTNDKILWNDNYINIFKSYKISESF